MSVTACMDGEVLRRLVAGTASPMEWSQAVRHLLAGCRPCAAALRSAIRPPVDERAYEDALNRLIHQARSRELVKAGIP